MQKHVVIVVALAAVACRQEKVVASVHCEVVSGPAIDCDVRQTKGTTDVEVCWDFKVTCDSGSTLVAPHTCAHVAGGKTTKTTIAGDKLAITGTCTGEKHATLGTMTVNGETTEP